MPSEPKQSKYVWKPKEMLPIIEEMSSRGTFMSEIYAALGVSKSGQETWRKKHPDYDEAMQLARTKAHAFWERQVRERAGDKTFNSRLAELALKALAPEDYRETRQDKVEVNVEAKVDVSAAVKDLLDGLRQAEAPPKPPAKK